MSTRRTPTFLLAFVAAVLAFAAVASAAPSRVAVTASERAGRVLKFELPNAASVQRAKVRSGRRTHKVPARRLARARQSGVLRVRVGRRFVIRRARLVVTYRRVSESRKRPKAPKGSTEPAPTAPEPTSPTPAPEPTSPTAPPAPTGTASVTCGLGTFAVGNWPSACWRPYSDSSPFNRRIAPGAPVATDSAAVVSRLAGFGTPQHLLAGNTEGWEHPVYYSQPTDPVFTLRCLESWGTCDIEGMQVRIPDAAQAAAAGDGHMAVIDQASGWEYDFWQVKSKPAGGGTLTVSWGGRTRIDGDGLGSDATASRFGNIAGAIRAAELAAGRIDHALFMTVYCDNGKYVYPAKKSGRSCASLGLPTAGAPAMGTRFQLAMSEAEIAALAVPDWKKTILRAAAEYGLYVGDTGTGSWGLHMESGATFTSFGFEDPMVTFARSAGVHLSSSSGNYVFNLRDGVDWAGRLRVLAPCTADGSC